MIEICMVVGLAQLANQFSALFLSDVDAYILAANAEADYDQGACPISYPRATSATRA
jgi:hypothetical protein